ncbi:MAG: c-type cytochrome [Candidatus Caldarchaeum sp.]
MGKVYWYILILTLTVAALKEARAEDAGLKVFVEKRCYTCHTINAQADALEREKQAFFASKGVEASKGEGEEEEKEKRGGDLSDVGTKRSAEWLSVFLENPKDYFKDDPQCQREAKKKQRKRFKGTPEESKALVSYMTSLKFEPKQAEGFKSCLKE